MSSSTRYWQATAEGRLPLGCCSSCNALHHPPRDRCPWCWSTATTTFADGRAAVHAFSVVGGGDGAYVVAVVELHEGLFVTTNVVDVVPEQMHIGMTVELTFREEGERRVPLFRPSREEPSS